MGLVNGKSAGKVEEQRSMDLKKLNVRVDQISIDGLGRTKDDIIVKVVDDLFRVNNFEEMLVRSNDVKNKLDNLGCFKNTSIHLDTSKGPTATPNIGYEVTFKVEELKHIDAGVNTMVGTDNEGLVIGHLFSPNILGRGERIQAEIGYGNKQTKNFNLVFSKPLIELTKFNARMAGSVFSHSQDFPMSMYRLTENGTALDLSFQSMKNLKHNIQWEGTIRQIHIGNRYAAFDVRENAGSTLKSSIKHILTYDTRRSTILPSSGIMSKLKTELAGVGGNVGFLKNEALLQLNFPLISDIVVQASIAGGCILPFDAANKSISICDHFFLGGPVTFRGFHMRGAGPSSDGNCVGAKMYWSTGLSVFTPLPFRPSVGGFGDNFRTHFFVNIGNNGNFNLNDGGASLLHQARLAHGIGLAFRLGQIVRLEINYCFPTWVQDGDRPVHGVQFGLSTGQ